MARQRRARSPSASTLSCITVENEARADSLIVTSTPPTSNTDVSSVSSLQVTKEQSLQSDNGRVKRVRNSVANYNANVLSGSTRHALQSDELRNISGNTLVPDVEDMSRQLVQDSIQVLDMDWAVDAMPGDEMDHVSLSGKDAKKVARRGSILGLASNVGGKIKSVLGKRGRGMMEASKGRLQDLSRMASLRTRRSSTSIAEEPAQKRMRRSHNDDKQTISLPAKLKSRSPADGSKAKRWLSEGLYVGQDADFDVRLTDTKNKQRRASLGTVPEKQRRLLPLPMFAGKRLIEQGKDFRLPFDVFSPLPPGQPKPEEWRKTQKNVFVGDAADFWKMAKRLEHSTCVCTPASGCDENCFNRFMFYECDKNNCNIGPDHCTNRSFDDLRKRCKAGGRYNVGVEVIKTADRGYGVRSNRAFEANQIIVEYTGEIITQEECDHRMHTMYKDNECFYLMVFDQNMIIDATRGSIARFVNHSCEPNCKMVKWTVEGKPRMALFAGEKGITTGEELTYDYNFDPFSTKNIQQCRCGTPSCRGVLGPKPKEKEARDASAQAGTKRKPQQTAADDDDDEDEDDDDDVACAAAASKKRKRAMPKRIRGALAAVKSRISALSGRTRAAGGASNAQGARLAKKASERSMRSMRRAHGSRQTARSTRSAVTFVHRRKASDAVGRISDVGSVGRPVAGRGGAWGPSASIRSNVVRTIRGTKKPANVRGKTMRVIGPDDEE